MLLKSGSSGIQVKYLQQGLKIMCCNPGDIDASYGPGTQAAVEKFQEEWGLPVDGIVGDNTWNCLVNEIKPIQQALKQKGFFSGTISGVATDNTYDGVLRFQKSRNLTDDGMVGPTTRARLFDETENGGIDSILPLSTGSKGDYVLNLQYGLRILCCSPGSADGVFGSGTCDAVKRYQSKYELEKTGIVDRDVWDHLTGKISDIQEQLQNKGYSVPVVNGLASSSLIELIKMYQEANWLTIDGQVGPSTYALLFSDVPDAAADALPLKLQSRGPRVLQLQYALRICCINPNGTDGVFGVGTQSAVNRYKTRKNLTADGLVDTDTWEKMRSDILPLQRALANRGYNVGMIDGIATEAVYHAVLQFQKDHQLSADGMIGSATKALLLGEGDGGGTVSAVLRLGSNGSLTRYFQRLLNELGYTCPINGIFSQETREAAIAFQTANHLIADGIIGNVTWKKLFELYRINPTGTDAEKLIQVAEHELSWGFAEDNANNITPYGQWYGMNGEAWCAMFVSYCADQAGLPSSEVPKFAWCVSGMMKYKLANRYHKRNSGYIPKKGDIVFFYSEAEGRITHTGIVVDGDEYTVVTIEGNTAANAVERRTYSRNHSTIDGYGDNGGVPISQAPVMTEVEVSEAIKELIIELTEGLGFQLLPPYQPVENQDLLLYQDPHMKLTFKCTRESSWYANADSPFQMNFDYGVPSLGINLTPNINIALEGVENREQIGEIITKLTISAEDVPVKIEYSVEGEWQKLSYIVEGSIFKGTVHEDTVAYGVTVWVRNVPENELSPVTVSVHDYAYSPSYAADDKAVLTVAFIAVVIVAAVMSMGGAGVVMASSYAATQCAQLLLNTAH